jgi:hypothetical protein
VSGVPIVCVVRTVRGCVLLAVRRNSMIFVRWVGGRSVMPGCQWRRSIQRHRLVSFVVALMPLVRRACHRLCAYQYSRSASFDPTGCGGECLRESQQKVILSSSRFSPRRKRSGLPIHTRDDGKRFEVRADEILTAFMKLERADLSPAY